MPFRRKTALLLHFNRATSRSFRENMLRYA